jgi:outer membrane protein TolC
MAVGAMVIGALAASAQQPLTLAEALRRADEAAYANRTADAHARAQSAQSLAALRGILPTARLEAGWVRTSDPTGAFGTTLRQRTITQADFDPARLNHPAPIGNYAAALVLEQPLFNADAYLGRSAAARAAAAAEATAEWTRATTRLDVVRAYYGAVLAIERVSTLQAAANAAAAHVRQAQALVTSGTTTRSDVLLARVKAGDVETQLIAARGDAAIGRRELALLIGAPDDTTIAVPARLPETLTVRQMLAEDVSADPAQRSDLRAAQHGVSAAHADVARARSLFVPRINAFARLDWNSAAHLYGGEENWTAGVMASWTPFAGASQIADMRAASGREAAARAGAEAAEARAQLEVERAETVRAVALARLDIAESAVGQSAEAHRIVARKYDGGLATVTELLDAAAVETQSGLGVALAVYEAIVAEAQRRQARGLDLRALAVLDTEKPKTDR